MEIFAYDLPRKRDREQREEPIKKQFEKIYDHLYLITCKCNDRKTVSSVEIF